ncbi:hypothetical protein CKK33_02380 [Mucilaginibacter sp. MD40]|uniref:hypothetical protein n=1 Tax=Mucilaginibacter sp. MD40 TaxID=2029590 RepID=UPI000BACAD79|nr:hypothetical protein [Mucilaginibacter sp. MD40]PAW92401.1 hypothetical protein CKK33_02380 [Mucilaginibacter sp. MD40]
MRAKLTVWALTALKKIKQAEDAPILERQTAYGNFEVILLEDTLWVVGRWGNNATSAFRTAYSPYGLTITNKKVEGNTAVFDLLSDVGEFEVSINFPDTASPLLHYAVSFKADEPLTIPYWPKDVLAFSETGKSDSEGELYIKQIGIRTGMIYAGYGGMQKARFYISKTSLPLMITLLPPKPLPQIQLAANGLNGVSRCRQQRKSYSRRAGKW